ncbi:MAG TPA: TIGR03118 family protein [Candidatus Angelobacter sp.]|nr:TIGR03118 family protein [Candidatus Angelobacter sp.]
MKTLFRCTSDFWKLVLTAILPMGLLAMGAAALADHGEDEGGDDGGRRSPFPLTGLAHGYIQINLVADISGPALNTDTNLLNPWGLGIGPRGSLIVAENHAGQAAFYGPGGQPGRMSIQVDDDPTGLVINHFADDFLIGDGTNSRPASLLFATESGKILGWNANVDPASAAVVADNSASNAVYKGIALARTRAGAMLYATDFHNGKVDMFDSSFHWVGSFTDSTVDAGFAPFNVQNIAGWLFVTFAKQLGPDNEDDEAGPGNGFVDIFRPDGRLVRRFASHGRLDSPWGLAVAPRSFGRFRDTLLVGNFGDGRINAYSLRNGAFLGQLADVHGTPIQIEGLWALRFGHDANSVRDDEDDDDRGGNALYFTAGPGGEEHGLLGLIVPAQRFRHGD